MVKERFDAVAIGKSPTGWPTLAAGGPGCGKTVFGAEAIVRGATQFGEPSCASRRRSRSG